MNNKTDKDDKPDIKLVRALQADFKLLYQKEFTTDYQAQRLIRNIELGIMGLPNIEKYIDKCKSKWQSELIDDMPERKIDDTAERLRAGTFNRGDDRYIDGYNQCLSEVLSILKNKERN